MALRAPYGIPRHNAPQWYVEYFTYQSGIPFLRTGSLAGGGLVAPNMPVGTFQPLVYDYRTRTASLAGGGLTAINPPNLRSLLEPPGGRATQV